MVSLSTNSPHSRNFYDLSPNNAAINNAESDEDLIVDHIELISGPEVLHRPIGTTWAIVLTKIIYVALGVSSYIIPLECGADGTKQICGEDPLSLTLYIHGGVWFTFFILDRYFHMKHNESRLNGYLDFYRKTQTIRRIPLLINSCANAIMVVVIKVLDGHCSIEDCYLLSRTQYVQILVGIECVLAIIVLIVYLVKTVRFNSQKALPDATQEDMLSGAGFSHSISALGYRNDSYDDVVMEKQADVIRYLKQHMEVLARRNLTLTEEIYQLKQQKRMLR